MSTISFSDLLVNSWPVAGPDVAGSLDFIAWMVWKNLARLPLTSPPLPSSPNGLMVHPVPTPLQNGPRPDWRWNGDKVIAVKTLVERITRDHPHVPPSAFLEAMDLTMHMFLECEPAGRVVVRNMAVDAELLLMASFLVVVQAYYDPAFTAEDMDSATDFRYAGFLQPSAWLDSIKYFLALDDEETNLAGLRDDRPGTLRDILPNIEEFKALIEAKIWQCGPISTGVEEPPAAVYESVADDDGDGDDVAISLSPRVHPLLHHYRSPSFPSLGVADDGHNVYYAPPEQDIHVPDEQAFAASQTPASSPPPPEFQTLSSSIPLNASPRADPCDRSDAYETIAHAPSSPAPFSVPHPSATPGSLAALLAGDPNDWTSQYAEIMKMVDNVNAVIHQTSHLETVSDSESLTESGPESAAAQEGQERPADSAFVATSFPSAYSFASSLGYIEISASSTPTPPWSIQVPSWDERVPLHHSYPQTVGGMSLDALQPPSLPRTGTGSSTLVEDTSSFAMKAKGSFATTTTSTTGLSMDWLASWRRNPTPSILSETTVDSEDSESSGWLADGSANSHCIPRRVVPVSRLIISPMSTHHDFPSTLAHHLSHAAPIPSESKVLTFVRRLKLPGYRSRQGKRTAALNISEPCMVTPLSPVASSALPEPEGLMEWQSVTSPTGDAEPQQTTHTGKYRWTQRVTSPRTWLVSRKGTERVHTVF